MSEQQFEPTVGEATDPKGVRVVLLAGVWSDKIVRDHPEIADCMPEVLATVVAPDYEDADPGNPRRTRYYARNVGPSRWLLVVVSYEQVPARIVSAFANRKDPRSWSV